PHVQDEGLCEGEGRQTLRSALEQGRLFEFFLVVERILNTYNAGSAYVSLDEWNGVSCDDCGRTTNEDDSVSCQECGTCSCDDCYRYCESCSESFCAGCAVLCA